MKGYFITIEGSDGSGKSTQLKKIISYLEKKQVDLVVTREPGGTTVAEAIRELILDPAYPQMTAKTEMLLYAAALQAGKVVLSDRYMDSSIAYQAYGRGLGDMVAQVNAIATGGLVPDLTIFLDLPPAVGMARKQQEENHELDRLEQEKLEFHQKVYEGYDALCKKEPERICRIDASGSIEEVFGQIKAALDELLDRA